jgi:hypothetical protein
MRLASSSVSFGCAAGAAAYVAGAGGAAEEGVRGWPHVGWSRRASHARFASASVIVADGGIAGAAYVGAAAGVEIVRAAVRHDGSWSSRASQARFAASSLIFAGAGSGAAE